MRTGISITITRSVRGRLEAITRDRNASQKHAWRAAIILSSADGVGTNEIMHRTGKSKTWVWRGRKATLRQGSTDFCTTRPGRRGSLRSVRRSLRGGAPWPNRRARRPIGPPIDGRASRISPAGPAIWKATGLAASFSPIQAVERPNFVEKLRMWSASTSIRRATPSSFRSTRSGRSRPSIAPSRGCR